MKRLSRRNSDKQKLFRLVLFIVGVLAVGFLLPRLLSFMGLVALYPFQAAQSWWQTTTLTVPALWREKTELQQQILDLQVQVAGRTDPSVSIDRLLDENQSLRSLLSATTSARVAAAVVGRPGQLPYDLLQLDQGSAAGIALGDPVYSGEEQVIGLVSRVYPGSSLVTLFTSPEFTTNAYVSGSDILAPLEGLGGGVARVSVPQGVPFQLDSLVYLPSIQPGVFGRIIHIENEPTQPQQFGYIAPAIAHEHLRYVAVGKGTSVVTDEIAVRDYVSDIQRRLTLPDIILASTTATSTATSTAP